VLTGGLSLTSSDGQTVDGVTTASSVEPPGGSWVVTTRHTSRRTAKTDAAAAGDYLAGLRRRHRLRDDLGRRRSLPGNWGKVGLQLCYEIIFWRSRRPQQSIGSSSTRPMMPGSAVGARRNISHRRGCALRRKGFHHSIHSNGHRALINPVGGLIGSIPWKQAGIIDAVLPPPLPNLVREARQHHSADARHAVAHRRDCTRQPRSLQAHITNPLYLIFSQISAKE
jgi:hypothetical protein